ncbi:hypothetical protein BP6252_10598 [Coleophoma cylindrospora]|uniref:Uncharacterized protein n=1 Tax=Coleophoma cylindrospora TaxID=1849047 RepID=A0A3D8QT36_9HELO|nr:hypothetical protein BP6252_10598 [Coleophoma cylindrospora]
MKNITASKNPPIVDNFPLAAAAHSASDLPFIPSWNKPPTPHVREKTPLFIGFTRNWRLIQQAVVSYITAGWPPEDIYVVENTGVMDSNKEGLLSLQNPFFLNHTRLNMLGVNVLITPTLFTFAQLQNFYLWNAIQEKYPAYFWSHMDVVAASYEDRTPFIPLYQRALTELRAVLSPETPPWALRFFAYDRLALVNTATYRDVGGWDTHIPFYMGDCDMHSRLTMGGYSQEEREAGFVWDVGSSLDDLFVLYRKNGSIASFIDPHAAEPSSTSNDEEIKARSFQSFEEDTLNSSAFRQLFDTCDAMQRSKNSGSERNTWQARQGGGVGDPFYRDPDGFEKGIQMTIEFGRSVYREKWGHRDCDIVDIGLKPDEAWKVEHDWDQPPSAK